MLQISKRPTFTTTVKVSHAAIKGEFPVTFEVLPDDRLRELEAEGTAQGQGPRTMLRRVVASFDQVQLPDGPVNYTGEPGDTGLETLLKWTPIASAMASAYYKALWEMGAGN